jgi:hypothetical protein
MFKDVPLNCGDAHGDTDGLSPPLWPRSSKQTRFGVPVGQTPVTNLLPENATVGWTQLREATPSYVERIGANYPMMIGTYYWADIPMAFLAGWVAQAMRITCSE